MRQVGPSVTKRIFIGENLFNENRKNDLNGWREVGRACGFVPVRANEKPEAIYLYNTPVLEVFRVLISKNLRSLDRFAINTEPTIVLPHLGWGVWKYLFKQIFWLGHTLAPGDFYPRPYPFPVDFEIPGHQNRDEGVVFVNANKISMSSGELYTLRREVLYSNPNIHVYGPGWADSSLIRLFRVIKECFIALQNPLRFRFRIKRIWLRPDLYHGLANDKVQETAKYKVALVIENSFELVTEKIFDAWLAGCIPVYVGSDLAKLGVNESLFIQAEPNVRSVEAAMVKALDVDHATFIVNLRHWMNVSSFVQDWTVKTGYGRVFK